MIHYLSATAIVAPGEPDDRLHLAFCGKQMRYGIDREFYQVANYSDPWRVDCVLCVAEWARIYPGEYADFLRRYPRPEPWRAPDEPEEVKDLRGYQEAEVRRWLTVYVRDESVSNADLMAALHRMTYKHARELAQLALEIHGKKETDHGTE